MVKQNKMKQFLFCLFLVCTLAASSQQKKDSKIIVSVSDTSGILNKIIKQLYQDGFAIDQKDEANGFILTKEKTLKSDASTSVVFKFLISDKNITVTGDAASNVTISLYGAKAERTFIGIYFGGMKRSSLRNAWNEMDNLAKQFGDKITYSK